MTVRDRLGIAARTVLAVMGGYAGAALVALALGAGWPGAPIDAAVWSTLIGLAIAPAVAMAAFRRRRAARPSFRQAMTWLHNWAGLTTGWLLLAIAGAGTLSVFRRELNAWCHPELARGAVDQARAGAAAARWLAGHAAHAPAWYLDLADARAPGTIAYWSEGARLVVRTLSPLTGSPAGIRDSLGGEAFYRFHFELQLAYPWGRLLACVAAEILLTILLTGIVAHRRIFKDFFTLRLGADAGADPGGRRGWLDGHVLLGVLALPFHIVIAVTGLVTLATLFLPWGGQAAYGGDAAALSRELFPAITRPATGRPAPLVPIAPLLRTALTRFEGAGIATLSIVNPGDAAQTVTVSAGSGAGIAIAARSLTFDGTSGRLLGEHVERRPAMRVFDILYGLHVARFADRATRWLYFMSGLMLTGATATGLILWAAKMRRARGVGAHLVARLIPGMIAGMPGAFALPLLANRLLPIDLVDRAAWETRWMFGGWAAALLFAALTPPARSWPSVLAAAAGLCGGVVVADQASGTARFDAITIGVDGTLIGFALALAASAMLVRRARA